MLESLIGVIPGAPLKQEGVGDDRACRLFKILWNARYAEKGYRVKVQWNDHDFGAYPDIGISESAFNRGIDDNETFPGSDDRDGIEIASGQLVDEWNARCDGGDITSLEWKQICDGAGLDFGKYPIPFKMDY